MVKCVLSNLINSIIGTKAFLFSLAVQHWRRFNAWYLTEHFTKCSTVNTTRSKKCILTGRYCWKLHRSHHSTREKGSSLLVLQPYTVITLQWNRDKFPSVQTLYSTEILYLGAGESKYYPVQKNKFIILAKAAINRMKKRSLHLQGFFSSLIIRHKTTTSQTCALI